MHPIAFIESRHATARALEGARRNDPVRREAPAKSRDRSTRRPRRDVLRFVPARAR